MGSNRAGPLATLGCRLRRMGEVVRRVDERHVRKGLREIAQHAPRHGIVFLGQEAHVVAKRQKALEEFAGFVLPVRS